MGLLDFFRGSAGTFKKHATRVANKRAQAADRWESMPALSAMGTSEAVEALLLRFTFRIDPSITDQEEKDAVLRAVVSCGDAAVEPTRAFLQRSDTIAWPTKVLQQLVDEEALISELLGVLEKMDTSYERDPQKKIQVLAQLEDLRDDRIAGSASRFFADANETSRFHAVGAALNQENAETQRPALLERLGAEESVRVCARILDGFIAQTWDLGEKAGEVREKLPPGYAIDGKGRVSRGS